MTQGVDGVASGIGVRCTGELAWKSAGEGFPYRDPVESVCVALDGPVPCPGDRGDVLTDGLAGLAGVKRRSSRTFRR